MNKLCCCADPDVPDISLTVTCACCESRVQQRKTNDSPDLDIVEMKEKKEVQDEEKKEEEKYTVCCCCFRRKRHAKEKKKKKRTCNGSST